MIALPPAIIVQEALPAHEVVVIGRRLRQVRFTYKVKAWQLRSCTIRKSSGDAATDAVVCETVRACVDERKLAMRDMIACLDARKPQMVAAIAARKKA